MLQTGDNTEPPPALSKLRSQEQARNDGAEALGGNLLCSQIRKASCFKHGVNNF